MTAATGDPVKAFFDSGDYLSRNPIIPVRAGIVAEFLGGVHNSRILDLGCGDGSISRPLLAHGNQLTLVDFSEQMLAHARAATPEGAPVEFITADVLEYVPQIEYDAVICIGLLAHVGSVDEAIATVSKSLRPGGLAVLQITDDASPLGFLLNRYYRYRARESYRLNTTSRAELVAAAQRHELTALRSRRYGLLLPGLGRLPQRWEAGIERATAERKRLARVGAELLMSFQKSRVDAARS